MSKGNDSYSSSLWGIYCAGVREVPELCDGGMILQARQFMAKEACYERRGYCTFFLANNCVSDWRANHCFSDGGIVPCCGQPGGFCAFFWPTMGGTVLYCTVPFLAAQLMSTIVSFVLLHAVMYSSHMVVFIDNSLFIFF